MEDRQGELEGLGLSRGERRDIDLSKQTDLAFNTKSCNGQDSTGSSFGSGPYVSHELRISRWLVAALASLLAVMLVVDTFYKSNPEDTNEYLAELNRKEKEAATEAKAKEKREK